MGWVEEKRRDWVKLNRREEKRRKKNELGWV